MTNRDHPYETEVEAERQAALRAEHILKVVDALRRARTALNYATSSIRHVGRFVEDISVMIDAIEAQRHE